MTLLARSLLVVALFLVAATSSGAAPVPGAASDVRYLAEQMESIHPDLYATVSRTRFRSAVDQLAAQAPSLSENELLVGLMRLAALPGKGNGHSGIFPGDPQHRRSLHFYPLRLFAFPDGTYVVDEKGREGLVGARVTAIGGVPYAQVVARVRPLVPHDNDSSLKGLLPHYVLTAEVLAGLGIGDAGELEFTFEQGGKSRAVTLSPIVASSYVTTFADPRHGHYPALLPRRQPTPLYLRKSASAIWLTTLDRGRAVFLGYNSVEPIDDALIRRLASLARQPKVKRVIVDLRLNGGGNNTTYGTLLAALQDSSINRRGRLVVLIGRATFSAAANFAADVDRSTKATFVGEATGGGVKLYGDAWPFTLPKTGIGVYVASRYWDFGKGPRDKRLAINPDIPVAVTVSDFLAGRDPVLAAALGPLVRK